MLILTMIFTVIAPLVVPRDNQLAADIASDSEDDEGTLRGGGASSSSDGSADHGEEDDHSDNDSGNDPNLDFGDYELETKAKGKREGNKGVKVASKTHEDEHEVCDGFEITSYARYLVLFVVGRTLYRDENAAFALRGAAHDCSIHRRVLR